MALAAIEAGVQCLRLNPGNLRKADEIKLVAREASDRGVPDPHRGQRRFARILDLYKKYGGATPEALVESAQHRAGVSSRRWGSTTSRSP